MKQNILKDALVNKVIKVRPEGGGKFKNLWAVRRRGQVRMTLARGR